MVRTGLVHCMGNRPEGEKRAHRKDEPSVPMWRTLTYNRLIGLNCAYRPDLIFGESLLCSDKVAQNQVEEREKEDGPCDKNM
jgi:hypothetical protein